jgi:HisJ family histidinol phosphate phosphatase
VTEDPRIAALPDIHGHAKGEHKPFAEERPIPYTARMLFLWFYHACRRGSPRFLMVADHMNYLTFEDPAAVNLVRRALKLAQAGDLYGAAETAGVDLGHAQIVSEGLRKGIRYSIGAEVDNDPRCRPDAQNIVDAMRPDGMIRSVHFLPITHPQHGENWMWPFDNPEFAELFDVVGTERVWEIYMATLLDAIEKLPGHIVAHFYVPAKFGHWPDDTALEGYEDRLLDACAERGMAVEINSRYIYKFYAGDEALLERFRSAHLRLLRKAKAKGVAIAVGSDAHSPKDQGRAFEAVLELLDEAEINEIAFPINGRLARVALRATEEILRQQSAVTPPAAEPVAPSSNGSGGAVSETAPVAVTAGSAGVAHASRAAAPEAVAAAAPVEPAAAPAEAAATPEPGGTPAPKKRPPRKRAAAPAPAAEETVEAALETAAEEDGVTELVVVEAVAVEAASGDALVVAVDVVDAEVVEAEFLETPSAAEVAAGEALAAAAPPVEAIPETPEVLPEPAGPAEVAVADHVMAPPRPKVKAKSRPKAAPVRAVATTSKPVARAAARPAAKSSSAKSRPAKAAPVAKPAAKKAVASKPAAKKAAPKTAASKKRAARPAAKPVKKAAPKKSAAARPAAAKATKKAPPKRSAPAKKTAAKKAVKKKGGRPRR